MSIAPEKTHVTLEELLASSDAGRFEIVNGELEELNVSNLSTDVAGQVFWRMASYCHSNNFGRAFQSDAYYRCFGEDATRARKPDASFIARDRLPSDWQAEEFFTIAPDLVVEVLLPHDLAYEVDQKIQDYLSAGVKLQWVINPDTKTAIVHRLDGTALNLSGTQKLSGETVLPGFECPLNEIFP